MAVHVERMPIVCVQPNGDTIHCFVTGDEYYRRLHDAQGFTILRHPTTGYYVYATLQNEELEASTYVVGNVDPANVGLQPNLSASATTIHARIKQWEVPAHYAVQPKSLSPKLATATDNNHGTLNNLVIFIRFSDENSLVQNYTTVDNMFNDTTAGCISMRDYFRKTTYGQLDIVTTYYPTPNGNTLLSYQDNHPRSYYEPYDATSNTNGYQNDTERTSREFTLIQNAVNYINTNYPVPASLDIDMNDDGLVDNICFVVSGTYTGWNDMLWPHKWSLYDRYVYINGKRVYTFNLQLENSGSHYFSVSTFCHEMNHTLGAPDLYRYYNYTEVSPAGSWDLMCSNTNPPQNMSSYMKYRYGNWLDTIPEIVNPGRYTLRSLADGRDNFCYRIPSQDPYQFFVLEYRNTNDFYDSAIPNSGLLVWRIDTRFDGNANYDDSSIFDGVYLYRPGGTNGLANGNVGQAYMAAGSARTAFSATSDPAPWLNGNVIDSTISLSNFTTAGDSTFSFTYNTTRPAEPHPDRIHCNLAITMIERENDSWNGASLRIMSGNGHLYGTAFIGSNYVDTLTQHIRVAEQDSLYLYWSKGHYDNECGFVVSNEEGVLHRSTYAGSLYGLVAVIPNGCPVEHEPVTITATANDEEQGSVAGAGTYEYRDTVTLTAEATDCYTFQYWKNGIGQYFYENPLSFIANQDDNYTAYFTEKNFSVLTSNDTAEVSAQITGSGNYPYGSTVVVQAQPLGEAHAGYEFSHWEVSGLNNGDDTIHDNPLQFTMPCNEVTCRAYYRHNNAIDDVSLDNIKVYATGHTIVIEGAAGQDAKVYDMMGREVVSLRCHIDPQIITLPNAGVYVVRLAGKAHKILIMAK